MLDEEILEAREKLDISIKNEEKYEIIYELSVELDKLIAKYYKEKGKNIKNKEENIP